MLYGFRILGPTTGRRVLVNAEKAFAAYARCDSKADLDFESYLSIFNFGEDFRQYLESTGSTRKYGGPCSSPYVYWDIDNPDSLSQALTDTRLLVNTLGERFQVVDLLLIYFSGNKGFHVGLPTALWSPIPSTTFNSVARRFAAAVAEAAQVRIDMSVYDKVRAFRAPNSRHPKSNLHKVLLSIEELNLPIEGIKQLAAQPRHFVLPQVQRHCEVASADWKAASEWVQQQADAPVVHADARLNRLTLDFIREGAKPGERAMRLFSAAANFAEFRSVNELTHALLTEPARDSGLSPSETRRQIDCGLSHRSHA